MDIRLYYRDTMMRLALMRFASVLALNVSVETDAAGLLGQVSTFDIIHGFFSFFGFPYPATTRARFHAT